MDDDCLICCTIQLLFGDHTYADYLLLLFQFLAAYTYESHDYIRRGDVNAIRAEAKDRYN